MNEANSGKNLQNNGTAPDKGLQKNSPTGGSPLPQKQTTTQDFQEMSKDQEIPSTGSSVYTYTAREAIYSMGFSCRPSYKFRLGIGTCSEDLNNTIEVIQLNDKMESFTVRAEALVKYPPTKLMWVPDLTESYPDIFATSGDSLKIWEVNETNDKIELKQDLVNNKQIEFAAPLTSFDWNPGNLNIIGTASIDTTCTIWDIKKGVCVTQLIAHDKEVYDISFSNDQNIFASVGADGSARLFDLRKLEHSNVLYETENSLPLLRLAWNKVDPNLIAVFGMEQDYITILDVRAPLREYAKLKSHKSCVNAIAWAPQSRHHLCSVGDDAQALIWDLSEMKTGEIDDPILEYKAEGEITNLSWSNFESDWLALCVGKNLQVLRL